MTQIPKRTPLYDLHCALGGRMVDFAGWEMPVQYPMGIMGEHTHCRTKAALFDVSHMGQVLLQGPDAALKLEALVPAALIQLPEGKARYGSLARPAAFPCLGPTPAAARLTFAWCWRHA